MTNVGSAKTVLYRQASTFTNLNTTILLFIGRRHHMETGAMNEPVASTPLWYGAIRAYRVPAHPPHRALVTVLCGAELGFLRQSWEVRREKRLETSLWSESTVLVLQAWQLAAALNSPNALKRSNEKRRYFTVWSSTNKCMRKFVYLFRCCHVIELRLAHCEKLLPRPTLEISSKR